MLFALAGSSACGGNPDYSSVPCSSHYPAGSADAYTSTCFDLLPLSRGGSGGAALRYGSTVVLREPRKYGGAYLNPRSGAFDTPSRALAGWTLVSVAAPQSTAVFTGEAFALRPGAHLGC